MPQPILFFCRKFFLCPNSTSNWKDQRQLLCDSAPRIHCREALCRIRRPRSSCAVCLLAQDRNLYPLTSRCPSHTQLQACYLRSDCPSLANYLALLQLRDRVPLLHHDLACLEYLLAIQVHYLRCCEFQCAWWLAAEQTHILLN